MRLHIGSGSVYLDGYTNLDVPGPKTFLAADRPDLVERWLTTEDQYYAQHSDKTLDSLRAGPLDQEYVCDAHGSFDNIPAAYWSVSEVLTRHAFEHLSLTEAHKALDQVDGILEPNGILRIDVPDHEGTLQEYKRTGDEFYVRHLLGPRRNDYGFHMMSYTRDRLRSLVESHGFVFVEEEPNIHVYPAFCLKFVKPGPRVPFEYVQTPAIPDDWHVCDVGPGAYPFPRANAFIERDLSILNALTVDGKKLNLDINDGLPKIENKSFDYVWCSHVLEHVDNPEAVAATLSRIGKRGTVVLPSTFKEMMFFGEEQTHQWQVLPNPSTGGPPIFIKNNPDYLAGLRDVGLQKIACQLYRTGPNGMGENQRYARQWFYRNESRLDVVCHWDNEFTVQVVE